MYRTYRFLNTPASTDVAGTTYDLDPPTAQRTPNIFQVCMSGPTSARPKAGDADMPAASGVLQAGIHYLDTTLAVVLVSDGAGLWRNPVTGATA
jgi:hypothetical protein